MVDVVIIVTMVSNDLVKTALQGQPSPIDFLLGIVIVCLTNCLYQLLLVSWHCIIETLYGSEKPQVQQINIR